METIKLGDQVFTHWTVVKLIGKGAFGQVFELSRQDFGTTYRAALKVISVPQNAGELQALLSEGMSLNTARDYLYTSVQEIVSEFALMAKLKGTSNIVSYEDHQVVPHQSGVGWDILIRMELLTPLFDYAKQHPFARRDVIRLGMDLCRALELCQKYNIIHRDIKPENIFVTETGNFKLGDFGIARTVEKTKPELSKKGTYSYMAPEIYQGKEYGFSVDTYSLGIVLYRLLNQNRTPFMPAAPAPITYGARQQAAAMRIGGNPIPLPYYREGRLPEIVLKACAYLPQNRYSSPMQMYQELADILYKTEDASIIYPDGDALSMQTNEYISSQSIDADATYLGTVAANAPVVTVPQYEPQVVTQAQTVATVPSYMAQPAQPVQPKAKRSYGWVAWMLVLVLAVGGGAAGYVYLQNQQAEKAAAEQAAQDEFETLLEDAKDLYETDPATAQTYIEQALEMQPENPDAQIANAYTYYLLAQYDTGIDYIENELSLGKEYDVSYQNQLAEILGACYYEKQEYAAAASFFRLSTAGGDISVSAMRDYAVSLGRLGDIEAADRVLADMFAAGATEMQTNYVQAEVDYAQGDYQTAQSGFLQVMQQSDDENLQIRAMRSLAELYRDCAVLEITGTSPIEKAAEQEVSLLVESMAKYGLTYDASLWEMLGFAYYNAYNLTPSLGASWLINAADAFGEVLDAGVQKEYLYTNCYTIYYQLGDYTTAEETLAAYQSVFPNAYTPHALRATMLIYLENEKEQSVRNYATAYNEYLLAESKLQSDDDRTYYQQVSSLIDTLFAQGWL